MAALSAGVILLAGALGILLWLFPPEVAPTPRPGVLSQQRRVLGPLSRAERVTIAALMVPIGGLLLPPILGRARGRVMSDLPTGTVTFLLTDIEGSTRLLQRLGDRHADLLAGYRRTLRAVVRAAGGQEVDATGDAFFAVFPGARAAVVASVEAQRAVATGAWPDGEALRVRIGIHTGEALRSDAGYVGMDVHRAARICDVAHGGQVVISEATRDLVEDDLPQDITLRDLGPHRLKDMPRPEQLYQVLHPDLRIEFPPLRSLENLPNTLPRQLTSFVGRERELADARRLLAQTYLLTMTGPGGSGKTRLALQVAAEMAGEFRDGVWYVDIEPVGDPGRVPQAVAGALALGEQPGRSLEATLVDYLKTRELLLVLDGCERVVEACAALADSLLRSCPGLRMIVTSREPLRIDGETIFRVPSMATPDPRRRVPLDVLGRFDAVRLFADRAASAQPGFVLTTQNAPWVAQITQRLDGIPLAIELAAARLNVLPVEHLAARLDDRFRLLTGGSRTAQRRQQTLRATIDWSYDLLSEAERIVFRRLSVFAGGFTLGAAEAVCAGDGCAAEQVLDLLTHLVDRSLVMTAPSDDAAGEARFWMLETVRQYASEALQGVGEAEAVRRRHLDYFLALAERAEPELRGRDQMAWFTILEMEQDNLRAALRWGLAAPDAGAAALNLAAALRWFWFTRGHLTEGRDALEAALALNRGSAFERAWALSAAALLAWRQRDYDAAARFGERSLALCAGARNDLACAYATNALALVARDQGDLERAEVRHHETLAFYRASGDRWGVALALQNLAYLAHRRGDYAHAAALCEESLEIFRDVGDRWGIATSMYILSRIAVRQNDLPRAAELAERILDIYKSLADRQLYMFTLVTLGAVARRQGNPARAKALLDEALDLSRELGDRRGIADAVAHLAALAMDAGNPERAEALYRESLAINVEIGNRQGIAEGLEQLAAVAVARGEPAQATVMLGAADALREAIGVPLPAADRSATDALISSVRGTLADERFGDAWQRGRTMPSERAIEQALGRDLPAGHV